MIQVVAVLVVNKAGELLLAERLGQTFSGLYDTPGGKANEGEDVLEAAIRELNEEAKVLLPRGRFESWGRAQHRAEDGTPFVVHYWSVKLGDEAVHNTEPHKHGPWEWKTKQWIKENQSRVMPSLRSPGAIDRFLIGYTHVVHFSNGSKMLFDVNVEDKITCLDPRGKNISFYELADRPLYAAFCLECKRLGNHTADCMSEHTPRFTVCNCCSSAVLKDECREVKAEYDPKTPGKTAFVFPMNLCKTCAKMFL